MSSNNHSASNSPSAKQVRLESLSLLQLLQTSPSSSSYSYATDSPVDFQLTSEQIQYVARDSNSRTGKCADSASSANLKHLFNSKWLADLDFNDKCLNMAIFHQDPGSCDVICGICSMHQEVVKTKGSM